jgi:hypothetical protein
MSKFVICLLNKYSEGVFGVYLVFISFFFTHLNQKPFVIYAGQGLFLGLPLIFGPTPWEYGEAPDIRAYTLGIRSSVRLLPSN